MELYYLVRKLVEFRLSYRQIQQAILNQEYVWLSKSTISYWARRIHNPLGKVNQFQPTPSPELAYVIGVVLGDGNLNIHGYNAELILAVTDHDFAEEFSVSLATILGRTKPYKVRWHPRKNRWIVQGSSILLYNFLHRDWTNLKKWIEHCDNCRASFLRAFYDGEGCISEGRLTISNTQEELLLYVQDLLSGFKIEVLPLHIVTRSDTPLIDSTTRRTYMRRHDCFYFGIRRQSLRTFNKHVGFTIIRKQRMLSLACERLGKFRPRPTSPKL